MTMKIELSPIGLYRVEFRHQNTLHWEPMGTYTTGWNRAFKLYRHRENARNGVGERMYVPHRIVPVYET